MRFQLIIFLIIFLSGCAKFSYLMEQSGGQLGLLNDAELNEKVLKDKSVPEKYKEKIRQVQKYKKFFYKYLEKEETDIYSKTTLLDREAVTFLVISSPFYEINARKECFPFMGCFPYLGFFKKDSAKEYAKEREEEGDQTYIRPVFAYSTLGYFTDTILSSFFQYSDLDLADLIFHELFHTIYFVKDEVELNENLANYFSSRMVDTYFDLDKEKKKKLKLKMTKRKGLNKKVVNYVSNLNGRYQALLKEKGKTDKPAYEDILEKFLKDEFIPGIKGHCKAHEITKKRCFPLKRKWNNASLAAFLTYENKADKIGQLHKRDGGDLKQLLKILESKLKEHKKIKRKTKITFSDYLFEVPKNE